MLRKIEEICADDDSKLQASFQALDNCSGKSFVCYLIMSEVILHFWYLQKEAPTSARQPLKFTSAVGMLLRTSRTLFSPSPRETAFSL